MRKFEKLYEDIYQIKELLSIPEFHHLVDHFYEKMTQGVVIKREEDSRKDSTRWLALSKTMHDDQGLGDDYYLISMGTRLLFQVQSQVKKRITLDRVNTNIQFGLQDSTFHTDGGSNKWTLLLYCSPHWDTNWGGEFIICKGHGDYLGVPYIPNRGVLFRADIPHRGSAPNLLSEEPRLSVAFTYVEV